MLTGRRSSTSTTAAATSCATSRSTCPPASARRCSAATASARRRCCKCLMGLLPRARARSASTTPTSRRCRRTRARASASATCRRAATSFRGSPCRESPDGPRDAKARRRRPELHLRDVPGAEGHASRRGGDLSGGQQQQLAIGRALALRPKLLILDEPTEGIQPSIIKDIERAIRKLTSGGEMAILLVEQYYDFAKSLADHYVVMSRGEVVAQGDGARHGRRQRPGAPGRLSVRPQWACERFDTDRGIAASRVR